MMVMLLGAPHQVAAAMTTRVYFTDESKIGEDVQRSIDGNQTDAGVFRANSIEYLSRGEMVFVGCDGIKHRASLWRELISLTPEDARDLFLCQLHSKL